MQSSLVGVDKSPEGINRAKEIQRSAGTLLAQIRNNDTSANLNKMAHPLSPKKGQEIEKRDIKSAEVLENVITRVDQEIQAGSLPADQRKLQIVSRTLEQLGGTAYGKLDKNQQDTLVKALMEFEISELALVEYQGIGGKAKGKGVTGSGSTGHYTTKSLQENKWKAVVS